MPAKRDPRPYQKPSGYWYVIFYDARRRPNRKWVTTGIQTRAQTNPPEAVARMLVEWADLWRRGTYDPWLEAEPRRLTVEEAVRRYVHASTAAHESPQTTKAKRTTLGAFLRSLTPGLALDALTPAHVRLYLAQSAVSTRSREVYWNRLRAFLNWCRSQNFIRHNVCDLVDKPTPKGRSSERRMLVPAELERIDTAIRHDVEEHPARIARLELLDVVTFAAATGLRLNELFSRRVQDYDRDRRTLRVDDAGRFTVKSEAARRTVPLFPVAVNVLERRLHEREPAPDAPLFGVSADWSSRQVAHYAREAGLSGVVFHSLRHTGICYMLAIGMTVPEVMPIVGHTSWAVMRRYARMVEALVQQAPDVAIMRHLPGYAPERPPLVREILAWLLDKPVAELERV